MSLGKAIVPGGFLKSHATGEGTHWGPEGGISEAVSRSGVKLYTKSGQHWNGAATS